MTNIQTSIRQWVLSVLAVDAVFWFLVGSTCLFGSENCVDDFTLGGWMFYQPFSNIAFPWLLGISDQVMLNLLSVLTLVGCHALLGLVVGWILQDKKIKWALSIGISFVVLIVLAFGMARLQNQQEIARETTTQLWAIDAIDQTSVTFRKAEWIDDTDPSTPFWREEEGNIWQSLENTQQTSVQVLCYSDRCQPDVEGEVLTSLSFDQFLAARSACLAGPLTCPYYSLAITPMLFNVTFSNGTIFNMIEVYVP